MKAAVSSGLRSGLGLQKPNIQPDYLKYPSYPFSVHRYVSFKGNPLISALSHHPLVPGEYVVPHWLTLNYRLRLTETSQPVASHSYHHYPHGGISTKAWDAA